MNRSSFLIHSVALALAGSVPLAAVAERPAPATAPQFTPTRFSVEVRGTGPDVILIPGMTSGREVWDAAVRSVPRYRYHLVQVNGFAGSPARGNAEGPVVAPLAEEIARYIAAKGLRQPAIVGHSMGGTIAMMVAARHPARVGRVMVVDMVPRPTSLYGGDTAAQFAAGLRQFIGDPQGRRLLSGLISAFSPPAAQGRGSDPDVVARAMHDLGMLDLTGELPRIRAPLTVVYAAQDVADEAMGRTFRDAYRGARGARIVAIPESGHLIMADQPARFARQLRAFLD